MGCIYIVRNTVNDKVYIGQTVSPLSKRWAAHLYAARTYGTTKLYVNMRSVGINNFFVEKLVDEDNWEELNRLEIEYIQLFDSINNGYNTMLGGTSIRTMLHKYADDIIFDYICGSSSMEISKQYNCSDETILNLLKSYGVKIRNHKRDIICVETGDRYKSFVDAAKYVIDSGKCNTSNLYTVAGEIQRNIGYGYKAYGFTFMEYADYINNGVVSKNKKSSEKEKEIISLLNKGYSYEEIADKLGSTKDAIRMFCKRHNLTESKDMLNYSAYLLVGTDFKLKFDNIKQAAEWVIDQSLVDTNDIKSIQYRLGISLKENKPVMGLMLYPYNGEDTYINCIKAKEYNIGNCKSVSTNYDGKILKFKSLAEAARWLVTVNKNISYSRIYDVSYNIGKACKENKTYEGLSWKYI